MSEGPCCRLRRGRRRRQRQRPPQRKRVRGFYSKFRTALGASQQSRQNGRAGDLDEPQVVLGSTTIACPNRAKALQPGMGPFYDPTCEFEVVCLLGLVVFGTPANVCGVPMLLNFMTHASVVIPLVHRHVLRLLRSGHGSLDCDGFDGRTDQSTVMHICATQNNSRWSAELVYVQMNLAACTPAISWICAEPLKTSFFLFLRVGAWTNVPSCTCQLQSNPTSLS